MLADKPGMEKEGNCDGISEANEIPAAGPPIIQASTVPQASPTSKWGNFGAYFLLSADMISVYAATENTAQLISDICNTSCSQVSKNAAREEI